MKKTSPHLVPSQSQTSGIGPLGWNLSLADGIVSLADGIGGGIARLPILPVGDFVYKGRPVSIRPEDAELIRSETLRLFDTLDKKVIKGATSWRPPIIREHEPDGSNDGRIVNFEVDELGLWAIMEFNESAWEEIRKEELQWFSPKVVSGYEDQWGNVYDRVILEVSLTSNPKLKHIGRVQDYIQLSEGLIMENEEVTTEAPESSETPESSDDLGSRVAALEEVVAVLAEKIAAMTLAEAPAEEEEAPAEAPAEEEEVALADMVAGERRRIETLILALNDKVDILAKSRGVRFMTVEKGNAGPSPAPKNREAEYRAQGLKGADLAAKLAGWE